MKKLIFTLLIAVSFYSSASAQFKNERKTTPLKSNGGLILGFINPKNFSMNHSFQVSMLSSRNGNVSLTSYTNSMNYKVSDRFNISADIKMQYSPFASSNFGTGFADRMQKDLSGIRLSKFSMDYKISDNSFIKLEYRNMDAADYYNSFGDWGYDRYGSPFRDLND